MEEQNLKNLEGEVEVEVEEAVHFFLGEVEVVQKLEEVVAVAEEEVVPSKVVVVEVEEQPLEEEVVAGMVAVALYFKLDFVGQYHYLMFHYLIQV